MQTEQYSDYVQRKHAKELVRTQHIDNIRGFDGAARTAQVNLEYLQVESYKRQNKKEAAMKTPITPDERKAIQHMLAAYGIALLAFVAMIGFIFWACSVIL